jgi:hypothetical protein
MNRKDISIPNSGSMLKPKAPFLRGQTVVVMAFALGTLIGALGLCTDIGLFYFNWMQLQKAADSAAIAGAIHLTGIPATTNNSQVVATANQYAQLNGIKPAEIAATTVASDAKSVTIQLQRTVPYVFARVLGLTQGAVAARATAGLNNTLTPLGMLPIGLPCSASDSSKANCNGKYIQYSQGGGLYNLNTKFPLGATGSWGKLAWATAAWPPSRTTSFMDTTACP